jgi:O-antigen/teichoic acid export membrane protein
MSILKKLANQTATYGLSSILGRFLNYLLVPIYTGVFAPDQYGISNYFYALISFGTVLFTYGMETAFFRFYQAVEDKPRVFATTLWSILLSSVLLAGLIFAFAAPLAKWTNQAGRTLYFQFTAIILAADAIATIPFAWLRQQDEAMRFAKLRLLGIGVNIGLNLLFYILIPYFSKRGLIAPLDSFETTIGQAGASVRWMFIANILSSLVVLPFFAKEFKMLRFGFDTKLWRTMLQYAYPLIFMGLAGMINETLDRILLKNLIADPTQADYQIGIYGANYKLSIIITLFIQAFRFAAEPFFFSQAKSAGEDSKQTNARVMQYFILVCATIFVVVMLYLDIFKYFIRTPEYWQGLHVVPILLLANLFLGAYYNLSIWYKLTDHTKLGALVTAIGAAITLILNYLWIPHYGYLGSAWATLICYFSMAVISYVLGQKYYPVPYPLRRIFAYLALALSIYFISDLLREQVLNTPSVSKAILLLINTVLMGIYALVVFKMEEKEIRKVLKRI